VADSSVLATVVPSGGSATISQSATVFCEIGLWFQPMVVDLPVELPEQKTVIGRLLNIAEIVLRLLNTSLITVNGQAIISATTPLVQYTGIKRKQGFKGWDYEGQVTITQSDPGDLTVLELSKRIIEGD
jgi:hypothetical protein